MFHRDVVVLELLRFAFGAREHLVHRLRDVNLRRVDAAADLRQALELAFDGELHRARGTAQFFQQPRHDAILLG